MFSRLDPGNRQSPATRKYATIYYATASVVFTGKGPRPFRAFVALAKVSGLRPHAFHFNYREAVRATEEGDV